MGTRYNNRNIKKSLISLDPVSAPVSLTEGNFPSTFIHNGTEVGNQGSSEVVAQYDTPNFAGIDLEDRYFLTNVHHIWTVGDHYWKLASEFYGDPSLWWLIAWYNQKPTEAHVKIGDSLAIPLPVQDALVLFKG